MTSIGLTPKNKADIQEIFRPYIKRSEDIFGRDDLNNLLGLFPTVVEQYDSLRLAGINGLEEILNRDQLVRREMEEEAKRKEAEEKAAKEREEELAKAREEAA